MDSSTHYLCHAFHKSLPGGKLSGEVQLDDLGLRFTIGEHCHRFSYQSLHIEFGGANNRLIFFSHPNAPTWKFYTSDRALLNDAHLAAHDHLHLVLQQARNKHRLGWAMIVAACLLVVATPVFVLLRMDVMTGVVATHIPPSWEEELGRSTLAQYRLGHRFIDNDEVDQYLDGLISPLIEQLPNSRYQYDFYIVDNSSLNAFALPGGEIVIHSGLVLKADSSEELQGVLAHEIIHVEQQHGIRNVIGSAGLYLIVSSMLGDASGLMALVGGAAPLLLNQSYSRGFERESDEKGFALLKRANINPAGLVTFFEKMMAQEREMLESIDSEDARDVAKDVLQFMSSHPATEKRIENLQKLMQRESGQHRYQHFNVEFEALKAEVAQFVLNGKQETSSQEPVDEN